MWQLLLPYSPSSGGSLQPEGKNDILLNEGTSTDKSPSKYTGPQTNDIINEIPSEDNDDDCEEPDDFSV